MKSLIVLLAVLLAGPVMAAGKNCEYLGSWLGYDETGEVAWTSQVHGQNQSHGTVLLEVPGFDFTFGGMFDLANYTGNLKGAWVRTGRHTYRMHGYGLATGDTGEAVYVMDLTCNAAVVGNCDVLDVTDCEVSLYVPDPDNDPIPIWNRAPDFGPMAHEPHSGYRITVD